MKAGAAVRTAVVALLLAGMAGACGDAKDGAAAGKDADAPRDAGAAPGCTSNEDGGCAPGQRCLDTPGGRRCRCTWTAPPGANKGIGEGFGEPRTYTAPKIACTWDPSTVTAPAVAPAGAWLVDQHGLAGDGVTDDAPALRALLTKAGKGAVIAFTGGRTYVLCRTVPVLEGQRLTRVGKGEALLERCAERKATLTQPVPKGGVELWVDDPSGFEVGMSVTVVEKGQTGQKSLSVLAHAIAEIEGKKVRIWPGLTRGFEKGAQMVTAFRMLDLVAPGIRLDHLVLDGNRSANDTVSMWQANQMIGMGNESSRAKGTVVDHCEFRRSACDMITMNHCTDCKVMHNHFVDGNGASVHFSTALGAEYAYNVVENIGAKAGLQAHTEGAVTWSLYVLEPWLHHNCVRNVPILAFGMLYPTYLKDGGSDGARIERNVVLDTAGFVLASNINNRNPDPNRIEVLDNTCVRCGRIVMVGGSTQPSARLIAGVRIEGNVLFRGAIELRGLRGATIRGNVVIAGDPAKTRGPAKPSDGAGRPLLVGAKIVDSLIEGNALVGGERGIWLRSVYGRCTGTIVRENQVLGASVHALVSGDRNHIGIPAHHAAITPIGAITGNTLVRAPSAAPAYSAVLLGRASRFSANCVRTSGHAVQVYGHTGTGPADETRVVSNKLRTTKFAVYTPGATGGLTVRANTMTSKLDPALTSGPTTTVSDNQAGDVDCAPCWPSPESLRWVPPGAPATLVQAP